MSDWKHGLCGCTDDMGTCCYGYWCGCCMMMDNANRLGKSGIVYALLGCFGHFIPILLTRQAAREQYNIEGSTCDDVMVSCCCACCSNIQTANEIRGRQF
eukprot:TRINITY_DN73495_c0_g1_i1.p1 TRINITY_DN73495_c0_g1~~TRINITY_DN73495_c0_g1_i1.p1  ORF type:complete len:100 (-),score=19.54 TRINITY_DN73495_c0_g1_i1:44-343(-)